jgi:hypothetical protein
MSASPSYTEAIVVAPQKTVYAVNGSINTTDTTVPCDQNDLRVYEQNVWGEMSELAPGTGGYTISPTGSLNTEGTNTVTITAAGSSGTLTKTYSLLVAPAATTILDRPSTL